MKRIPQERIYPHGMSPLAGMLPLFMTTLPQQITNRYISNLVNKGRNDTFEIITIQREQATHDGIVVGSYYDVIIRMPMPDHASERASGVTIAQAVNRCLAKFGVTFRE